jgi:hypothetical protein
MSLNIKKAMNVFLFLTDPSLTYDEHLVLILKLGVLEWY